MKKPEFPSVLVFSCAILFAAQALYGNAAQPTQQDTVKSKAIIVDEKNFTFRETGKLPKKLKEASGLEITRQKNFWSHNDDGLPFLYCMDSLGTLVRAVQLNVTNRGWEDLTLDDAGNMYIGGFGNNENNKKDLRIYKISNPDSITALVTIPEIIEYTYEDQKTFPAPAHNKNFDVDACFAWDKYLYLFTKDRSNPFRGYSKVYRLAQAPGKQTAELIDSLYIGNGPMINNWITSADLSPDKKTLALLFHDRVWLVKNFTPENFSMGKIFELRLNHYSHKAGISFVNNSRLYIVDELEFNILGGKMYTLDFHSALNNLTP